LKKNSNKKKGRNVSAEVIAGSWRRESKKIEADHHGNRAWKTLKGKLVKREGKKEVGKTDYSAKENSGKNYHFHNSGKAREASI